MQASTTTSVSSDRAGILAAIDSNLQEADQATQLLLSSGFIVPIEAERVLKPAAMSRATKYFDDDENEGLGLLTANVCHAAEVQHIHPSQEAKYHARRQSPRC